MTATGGAGRPLLDDNEKRMGERGDWGQQDWGGVGCVALSTEHRVSGRAMGSGNQDLKRHLPSSL